MFSLCFLRSSSGTSELILLVISRCSDVSTPGSMNGLYSDLFKKFEGINLGVCGTIWERFWEENWSTAPEENASKAVNKNNLFNDRGVTVIRDLY